MSGGDPRQRRCGASAERKLGSYCHGLQPGSTFGLRQLEHAILPGAPGTHDIGSSYVHHASPAHAQNHKLLVNFLHEGKVGEVALVAADEDLLIQLRLQVGKAHTPCDLTTTD